MTKRTDATRDTSTHHNMTPTAILSWLYRRQDPEDPQDPPDHNKQDLSRTQPTNTGPGIIPGGRKTKHIWWDLSSVEQSNECDVLQSEFHTNNIFNKHEHFVQEVVFYLITAQIPIVYQEQTAYPVRRHTYVQWRHDVTYVNYDLLITHIEIMEIKDYIHLWTV